MKNILYIGGLIEIIVGICTLTPRYRSFGTLRIFILMIAFLPLHIIIDVFKDKPVIDSHLIDLDNNNHFGFCQLKLFPK
jgi:uncharacterized membrane protein